MHADDTFCATQHSDTLCAAGLWRLIYNFWFHFVVIFKCHKYYVLTCCGFERRRLAYRNLDHFRHGKSNRQRIRCSTAKWWEPSWVGWDPDWKRKKADFVVLWFCFLRIAFKSFQFDEGDLNSHRSWRRLSFRNCFPMVRAHDLHDHAKRSLSVAVLLLRRISIQRDRPVKPM